MTLEEKRDLIELAVSVGLLGEQVTMAQVRLKWLVDRKGYRLSSPEALEAAGFCSMVEAQFLALEEEYRRTAKGIRVDGMEMWDFLTS